MKSGTIEGLDGHWGSGLATLYIGKPTGNGTPGKIIEAIPCDNGPTVRALDTCFGGVIREGHQASVDHLLGTPIEYELDSVGVLTWFQPAGNYDREAAHPASVGGSTLIDRENTDPDDLEAAADLYDGLKG